VKGEKGEDQQPCACLRGHEHKRRHPCEKDGQFRPGDTGQMRQARACRHAAEKRGFYRPGPHTGNRGVLPPDRRRRASGTPCSMRTTGS